MTKEQQGSVGGMRMVGPDLPSSQALRLSMREPEFIGYTCIKYLDRNPVSHSTLNIQDKGHDQQVEGDDSPPLLCLHETSPEVLCPALGPPA